MIARSLKILRDKKGICSTEQVILLCIVCLLSIMVYLGYKEFFDKPGNFIESYNTTCTIENVYEDSITSTFGNTDYYYVQVSADGVSKTIDDYHLYLKYKDKVGSKVPAEITVYEKDSNTIKEITKVL